MEFTNANPEPQQPASLTTEQALHQAVAHHQAGQLQDAERLYRAILQAKPNHPDANHNLGVLAVQVQQVAAGLPYFKMALEANPNQEQYWLSYADALLAAGQSADALNVIQNAIGRGYTTPAILALRQKTEAATAGSSVAGSFAKEVKTQTSNQSPKQKLLPQAEMDKVVALFNAGRYVELECRTLALVEQYPDSGFVWKALGASLQMQSKDAVSIFQKTVELLPDDANAYFNLGVALQALGQLDQAMANYRRALEIKSDYDEASNNLGTALQDLGRLDEAIASFRRTLEIRPDYADAYYNLGNALKNLGQLDDATASYRRALEIKPNYVEAHNNLGNALQGLGQLDDATANFRRALEFKPDFADAHSNLLFTHNCRSDQTISEALADARHFGDLVAGHVLPYVDWHNVPEPSRRLRIGFVSADLRTHPVGYFLESILAVLATHASARLELIAYANDFRTDIVTERLKACCNGWHCVRGLSDEHLAKKIRADGIDILIDLSGHTGHNRLTMFARKPAPIQASWLGYFATTGVKAVDYLIADPWVVPKAEEAHFTETITRLPETYLCFTAPDLEVHVSALPALKAQSITFGCFNNLVKMNHAVVAVWARVLMALPGSRLFLKTKQLNDAMVRQSVMDRFAVHGIGPERLILERSAPRAELLAAYQRVDIALDPFPYPGGTTSVEALWMGVPVLTLAGDRFLSHIGESILHNAGLPDWIAVDADDYVARAVAHAQDLPHLSNLRGQLRQQVLKSPIFDAPRFAGHLEATLRSMWVQWCNQQPQQKL